MLATRPPPDANLEPSQQLAGLNGLSLCRAARAPKSRNLQIPNPMKLYLLTIYQPDGDPPPPEVLDRVMRDIDVMNQELKATNSWVFAGGLHPASTATVVRVRDGDTLMTDGPYVEGKEHVGGFTIIKASDLDAALEWGRRLAKATTLPIEVRPFQGEVAD